MKKRLIAAVSLAVCAAMGICALRQRGFGQCIYRGGITGAGVAAEAEYDNSRSIWNSG